jgi:hypothetical protein
VDLLREVALVRAALEQRRPLGRSEIVREPERPRVLRRRLSMRAERRCARRRLRREAEDGVAVACSLGMVGETGRIGRAGRRRGERLEHRPVERGPSVRRDRVLDCEARELVPERDRVGLGAQDAGGDARVELLRLRHPLEQPELHALRHDRDGVEQGVRCRVEACDAGEDGVAHRRRDPRFGRGEHLRDEERVPAGANVQLGRVDVAARELGDGLGRERRQAKPVDARRGRELAEHDTELAGGLDLVVAVGRDQRRGHRLHAPAEQAHEVERRLVRPVQVLEHEDRRRLAAELLAQGGHELVRLRAAADEACQLAAGRNGDVGERPQRTRREERLAAAERHRAASCAGLGETLGERLEEA